MPSSAPPRVLVPSFLLVFTIHVQLFERNASEATTSRNDQPPFAPGIDAEARSLHFYETPRTPSIPSEPTDQPIDHPCFLSLRFTYYSRVLFDASPWNSYATIYSKSIFRLPMVLTRCYGYVHVCMYISKRMYVHVYVCVEAYAAKTLQMRQETARASDLRGSTIFPRIYVDYPACYGSLFLSRYTLR